jgi:molecular chaperone DnaJ
VEKDSRCNGYERVTGAHHVWIPKKLNSEERRTLEKLMTSPGFLEGPSTEEKSFFEKMKDMFE